VRLSRLLRANCVGLLLSPFLVRRVAALVVGQRGYPILIRIVSVLEVISLLSVALATGGILQFCLVERLGLVENTAVRGAALVSVEILGRCIALSVLQLSILVVTAGVARLPVAHELSLVEKLRASCKLGGGRGSRLRGRADKGELSGGQLGLEPGRVDREHGLAAVEAGE
jgi:hypothetical protein